VQVGAHAFDFEAGNCGHEVQPVRADVGDGPERPALVGQHAPVEIGVVGQPVLRVRAGDVANGTEPAVRDTLPGFEVERVEADVVVDGRDDWRPAGEGHQLGRLAGVHCQRLFADDVLAGFDGPPALL